ncbi:hypothetical protein LX81_03032 [Palleronia aestuarii]|uniref:Uncharacterized protein n=1 Tax=Palleronia aestuarii TaxID=568105 RepID=A0A2W7N3H2_9RHOB|nr:hypothetical protein [Palleronia aestuarii]PZX14233.1 hypothetical protein LX81_03032 [Palleronia aestuarii]
MKVWILRRLRAETRAWWAHLALRQRGEIAEAAARERASVRSDLDVIRKTRANPGAYVSCGIGGTTIHYARGCTLSSYSPLEHVATAQVLVEMGLPLIDTRPVVNKHRIIGLPLVAVGHDPDPEPWRSMSYAPLCVYAARAAALGARTRNIKLVDLSAPQGWAVAHA